MPEELRDPAFVDGKVHEMYPNSGCACCMMAMYTAGTMKMGAMLLRKASCGQPEPCICAVG